MAKKNAEKPQKNSLVSRITDKMEYVPDVAYGLIGGSLDIIGDIALGLGIASKKGAAKVYGLAKSEKLRTKAERINSAFVNPFIKKEKA